MQGIGQKNRRRRIRSTCCAALLFFMSVWPVASAADATIHVLVDGRALSFDAPPRVVEGRTLVPMRAIFEALGAEVQWDGATETVTARRGETTVSLTLGAGQARVDQAPVPLDVPARIIDGRTFVPLRFVGEALGAGVVWDGTAQTVHITATVVRAPAAPGPPPPTPSQPSQPSPSPRPQPSSLPPPPAGQPAPAPAGGLPPGDLDAARQIYPPHVASLVLESSLADLGDVYACIGLYIGSERVAQLRGGAESTGTEKDVAALCLLQFAVPPAQVTPVAGGPSFPPPGRPGQPGQQPGPGAQPITVEFVQSDYKVAPGGTTGFFKTGQDADILLSGFDFHTTGGPLLFNHPSGLATDGTGLILADTFNNRVLIWHRAPTGNVPPDLVLGQKDFTSNAPGRGLDQMNWPFAVATDGERLVVTDVMNDRVLVWNSFPSHSGAAADVVLGTPPGDQEAGGDGPVLTGPWGAWTDGERLVVTNTWGFGGKVWIWNRFPTANHQTPDLLLSGGGDMGTPRHVTSDGHSLIIGDHNARVPGQPEQGAFFWQEFPTAGDPPYDFYLSMGHGWPRGTFTLDGKLILMGGDRSSLQIWDAFPQTAATAPTLAMSQQPVPQFAAGDYEHLVMVGERLYVSLGNGNRVVGFHTVPTRADQRPDFAIGSPDVDTNTLGSHYFVQNGVPASNGKSLFVSSDFDRKLYVWQNLPDESGAHPDIVYSLGDAPWDNALWGDRLVLAGRDTVWIWNSLPLDGQQPDRIIRGGIGSVKFKELKGVALDDRYFYLGDAGAGKLYVWAGIPDADTEPKLVLNVDNPWMLSSDGTYLGVAAAYDHVALVYPVATLAADSQPARVGGPGRANGVHGVSVAGGHLFVADGFNRILVWRDIAAAMAGQWPPDAVLGEAGLADTVPEIGRNKVFSPRALHFDGHYLWVGEVKFSNRMLRFSPSP